MTIQVKELRIHFICPKCGKDGWVLVLEGEFEPEYQECWNCHNRVKWELKLDAYV